MATLLDRGSTPLISTILHIYASSIECLLIVSILLAFLLYTMNMNLFRFYLGFVMVVGYRKN